MMPMPAVAGPLAALSSQLGMMSVAPAAPPPSESKAEVVQQLLNKKTRTWEQENHVLGHNARTNLRRWVLPYLTVAGSISCFSIGRSGSVSRCAVLVLSSSVPMLWLVLW
jgi:hypothetical protein